jgi:hypothetical protein
MIKIVAYFSCLVMGPVCSLCSAAPSSIDVYEAFESSLPYITLPNDLAAASLPPQHPIVVWLVCAGVGSSPVWRRSRR